MFDDYTKQLLEDIRKDQNHFEDELERQVIERFGSVEQFKKVAHLFVLETNEMAFVPLPEEVTGLEHVYSAEIQYRIRRKTQEEIDAERKTPEELAIDQADANINHYLDELATERIELDEERNFVDDMWKSEDER
ncbi:hypothetical protein SEA_ARCADIA_38 [Arthrobacter phage Arcadia]|uniref:Uncharacterized protein n=1 Tax=Arthrobacter phage Arcadia TaxID=2024274 RepID=A0A222Z665_9CAUD|nr:hypothetical protein PQB74_gp38 [Arthrobacter phage Arcadia]ASR80002.1 hypothetical protein SEA_ARCADIA_38 [Arthrobacter phage Arcadia]ASR80195.1 hypothetical protein SEA_ELSA_38 [Arthrobacter phage Elsa]ASR80392.1 hypothetical protein SEA_NASON_38 [Arthrobacter phage Nason]